MIWRKILGGVLGFLLWWFLFFVIGIGIGALWPEYREAARLMFQEGDTSGFITPLLFANYFLFISSGLIVGIASTLIAKSRVPGFVLSVLFLLYMVINHYVLEWDSFPSWYNLLVPFIVSGSIFSGCGILKFNMKNGVQSEVNIAAQQATKE